MKPASIGAYLKKLPPKQRAALQKLRRQIQAAAPKAKECFSYGLPAFRLGRPLVAFAATKHHCSVYPMSGSLIKAHAADLKAYSTSKGTIRFTPDHPLPATLVRKLVKVRLAELGS